MSDVYSLIVISIVFAVIGFLYGLFIKGSLSKAILYGVLGLILPVLLIILLILMIFLGLLVLVILLIMAFLFLIYIGSIFWRAFHQYV